jgi:hypothetical protein
MGRAKTYAPIKDGTLLSVRIGGSVRVPLEAPRTWATHLMREAEGLTVGRDSSGR